jgi:hypothetical protein
MDPAVLDPHRTAASRDPIQVAHTFVHHSTAHGYEDEAGDRSAADPGARLSGRGRDNRDRESTQQLLLK